VQDSVRGTSERIAGLLKSTQTHVYICGLKDMEHGVESTFVDICRAHGLDWEELKLPMRTTGRYHVETY
jgi:benzoyl-CoA 2,3-epoxidase subunit A